MMRRDDTVSAFEFCAVHRIEMTFLNALDENGIIELVRAEDDEYIPVDQLRELEMIVRLHNDFSLEPDAIDTVIYLIHRIEELQQEISDLRNKLRLYEEL
jgi:prefoldin subunit 5